MCTEGDHGGDQVWGRQSRLIAPRVNSKECTFLQRCNLKPCNELWVSRNFRSIHGLELQACCILLPERSGEQSNSKCPHTSLLPDILNVESLVKPRPWPEVLVASPYPFSSPTSVSCHILQPFFPDTTPAPRGAASRCWITLTDVEGLRINTTV